METTYYKTAHGLPDPQVDAQFYDGVPARRAIAWVIDMIIIVLLALIVTTLLGVLTLGIMFFFAGLIGLAASFAYRVIFLANNSATPGMMLMGIEFRTLNGEKFGLTEALIHTTVFMMLFTSFIGHVASCITMTTTRYGRALPDFLLGSTVINRTLD